MSRIQGASIAALLALATATAHADTVLVNTAADEDNLIGTKCSLREAVRYIHEKNIIKKDLEPVTTAIAGLETELGVLENEKKQLEVDIDGATGDQLEQLKVSLSVVKIDIAKVESALAVWKVALQGIENQIVGLQIYGCVPKATSSTDEILLEVRDDAYLIELNEIVIQDPILISVDTSSTTDNQFTTATTEVQKPATIQVVNNHRAFRIDDGNTDQAVRITVKMKYLVINGCRADAASTDSCATDGGIIHNREILELNNTTLTLGGATSKGGAIYNDAVGILQFIDSSITRSRAPKGAAMYSKLPGITFQRSLAAWNNAITATGTVIDVETSGTVVGGGSSLNRALISDSTISTNKGTAISVPDDIRLNSLTIVANTGGVDFRNLNQSLNNSIIAGNTTDCLNVGASTKFRFNLYQGAECPTGAPADQNTKISGSEREKLFASETSDSPACDLPPANGLLCPLGNYGGETLSHKPRLLASYNQLSDSPIVNKGSTAESTSGGCAGTDQRGKTRTLCDVGAVELITLNSEKQGQDVISGETVVFSMLEKIGDGELLPASRCAVLVTDPRADLTKDGCPIITIAPGKGSLRFDNTTRQVIYTPNSPYHGFDRFSYSVTTTLTRFSNAVNNKDFTMNVTVVADPAKGIETKSFAGAISSWALLLLAGLGLLRRRVSRG